MEKKLEFAWLTSENQLFATVVESETAIKSGQSPIVQLIEHIYHSESLKEKSRARSILRERIFTTLDPSMTDLETMKVTAKRITVHSGELDISFRDQLLNEAKKLDPVPKLTSFPHSDFDAQAHCTLADAPRLLSALLSGDSRLDRKISAILTDSEDRILAWSWNTSSVIRTRHAEWNICAQTRIPRGAKLYVTLKPCRMCAARIWESAEDPATIQVIYLENDPGPLAQGTLLDAESPARRRLLGAKHPLYRHVMQKQMHLG